MIGEGGGGVERPATWRIRAGSADEARAQFLDLRQPVVAVGWCEQENLSWLTADIDAFKAVVAAYYPGFAPPSVSSAAGHLCRFVHEMCPGDYVVYPEKAGGLVHCGRVEGEYAYREGTYPRHNSPISPHVRRVAWLQAIPRSAFTPEELKTLSTPPTLVRITLESLLERCFPDRDPDSQPTSDRSVLEQRVTRLRSRGRLPRPSGCNAPRRLVAAQATYERDPSVKAWVLQEAAGTCELCLQSAPFMLENGEPYLEVHHVLPLAEGGADTVENAAALCPNCHRRVHLGADANDQRNALRVRIPRLVGTGLVQRRTEEGADMAS